jgi:ABC-type molybdate transport system substrate-binding protein
MLSLAMFLREGNPLDPGRPQAETERTLVFRCAAGIQPPAEQIIAHYRRQYPQVAIEVDYQGSGTLLESIRIEQRSENPRSDLYLAADEAYIDRGRSDGLLAEVLPVARQTPVIAVKKGNPKNIRQFQDLLRPDVAVALADPEGAAIGRATRQLAVEMGVWDQLLAQSKSMVTKVPELVNAITIGDVIDAAIIWDATVAQVEALELVLFPEAGQAASEISIAIVAGSTQPTDALRFARFFASRDQGQPHFVQMHYQPVRADLWSEHPQVTLYAGSMFQAGIEETIARFERREGVIVDRVYNGCGILTSQMLAGGKPEAYLSCDQSYMDRVADLFGQQTQISENDMVIVVKRGNPLEIGGVPDLARPGIRLGVCHPTDSALGALTKRLLSDPRYDLASLYDNPTLMVATGPMLMNAIAVGKSGGLDAAIVYRSNVLSNRDNLQAVEIVEIEQDARRLATAVQPWAIARETDNPRLLERLYQAIVSDPSRQAFTSAGFRWLLEGESASSQR